MSERSLCSTHRIRKVDQGLNLHPFIVHFPLALLILSALSDTVGILGRREQALKMGYVLLLLGTLGAIGGALSGQSAAEAAAAPSQPQRRASPPARRARARRRRRRTVRDQYRPDPGWPRARRILPSPRPGTSLASVRILGPSACEETLITCRPSLARGVGRLFTTDMPGATIAPQLNRGGKD